MNKIVEVKLKRGMNQYPVKLGAPRLCLGIEPGPVAVLLVDTLTPARECFFTVAKAGDNVADSAGTYLGTVKGNYVFSNCFAS